MSGLVRAFESGHPALVVYVMAGFPDRATSLASLRAAAEAGADLIELGVPYGDPLADGPVIAAAGHAARALPGGFGLVEAIGLAAEFTAAAGTPPVALMCYYNPILRLGLAETARRAQEAGVSGFIVPDLPPDEAGAWREAAAAEGIDTVFLVAPTSTPERIALVADASTGFIYCVSTTGITGERAEVSEELVPLVERVKAATGLPVAVGFGISTPEQAGVVARLADGVVVGSAVVKRQGDPAAVGEFVAALAEAVHSAR